MKVLLVSGGSGSRGGGEIFLDYLGNALTARGHEVLVWIPAHSRMDELAKKCARFAQVIRSDYRNTYDYAGRSLSTCFNWGLSRRLASEWEHLEPDIVHINKQNLEDGLDLLRAARRCALPSVCTIHLTQTAAYLGAKGAWLRDMIARWHLIRYSGVFVAVQERRSHSLAKFLSERVRIKTIFNGVPIADRNQLRTLRETTRRELGLSDGDLLALGVGRMVEQKRPMLFLHVAKELCARIPNAKFLWVGDGNLVDRWQEYICRERLEGRVSCAGWQDDVLPFLAASDLLVHVAEFEGLPFGVIEAMAAEVPCAVTCDLSSEVPLFDHSNVLFVDDLEGLASKLQDESDLRRIARGGYRLVEHTLSADKMAESYEQLYSDVKARSRAN